MVEIDDLFFSNVKRIEIISKFLFSGWTLYNIVMSIFLLLVHIINEPAASTNVAKEIVLR